MEGIKVFIFRTGFFFKVIMVALFILCFTFWINQMVEAKRQESVKTLSWVLVKKVIVVDPGHGGVDPGAVGKNNVREKDLVLAIGNKLTSFLQQGGAKVIMTRKTDTDLSDPELRGLSIKKRQDLARRVALANDNQADVMVSIHVNSFPNIRQHGAQTFCQANSPESRRLAMAIQKEFNYLLENEKREPLPGDYYILNKSKIPTVLIEIGFLSNPQESKLLSEPAYQTKIAWCLYAGLVYYFAMDTAS